MGQPELWVDKKVSVCGEVSNQPDSSRLVYEIRSYGTAAVILDEGMRGATVGGLECFRGVFRRRDGLTHKEALKRGRVWVIADSITNPLYFLSRK